MFGMSLKVSTPKAFVAQPEQRRASSVAPNQERVERSQAPRAEPAIAVGSDCTERERENKRDGGSVER